MTPAGGDEVRGQADSEDPQHNPHDDVLEEFGEHPHEAGADTKITGSSVDVPEQHSVSTDPRAAAHFTLES
jgi:hypothetical protein